MRNQLFKNKKLLVLFFSSALLVTSFTLGLNAKNLNGQVASLKTLESGIATCSYRVVQSFGAWASASTSGSYTSQSFFNQTQACFGEALSLLRAGQITALLKLEAKLNELTQEISFFHQALTLASSSAKLTANQAEAASEVSASFKRIEEGGEAFSLSLDKLVKSTQAKAASFQNYTFATLIFTFILFVWLIFNEAKLARKISRIGEVSADIIKRQDWQTSSKIDQLMLESLTIVGSENVVQLFSQYHEKMLLATNVRQSNDELSDQQENSFEAPSINITQKPTVDFSETCHSLLARYSDDLFAKGVFVDIEVDRDRFVMGEAESIEQVIYLTLGYAINKAYASSKKIYIRSKPLADRFYFKVAIVGSCFTSDEMEIMHSSNISNSQLAILKQVVNDLGVELVFKNRFNDQGEINECYLEFVFTLALSASTQNQDQRTLTSVTKTTKKQLKEKLAELG
jgi:hypothetical protein